MRRPRIAVLVSGRGRNLQALIDATGDGRIPGDIVDVVSDRAGVPALSRAGDAGIPATVVDAAGFASRAAFDSALAGVLEHSRCDIVAMAGFMRVLGDGFIARFAGRMLNIHPSLLPRHPGLRTHAAVLAAGEREHGATVHFVTPKLDGGPRVIQGSFTVRAEDDAASLAQRALEEVELHIFPQAMAWMARAELTMVGDAAQLRGRALATPLSLNDLEAEFR